jgi:hypothetical protein
MNRKQCPFCGSVSCVRNGFQEGHQRWKCKHCFKKFQANRTAPPSKEELFCLYVFNKQTLVEIGSEYGLRTKAVQHLFDEVVLPQKKHAPRPVALCVDATFFGAFGVVVFRDQIKKENLWWSFCTEEWTLYYERGRHELQRLGYTFTSVTADGLPGLPACFKDIPFQYCHFHAKKNITKYLTKNPKTDAGVALLALMERIHLHTEPTFILALLEWRNQYQLFLDEKTYHPGGTWSYTHTRLKSALRSMSRMIPYLFTYQRTSTAFVPRTTNSLEGHFRHLKVRVNVHCGISMERKQKLIEAILLNSSATYQKGMEEGLFMP